MNIRRKSVILVLIACAITIPTSGNAGSIWLDTDRGDEIRLEGVPSSYEGADFSTLSMAWFLSGNFQAGRNLHISVELPFSHFADSEGNESSSTIGNLYLGVDFGEVDSGFLGEFGVRIPLTSVDEEATRYGAFLDPVDRMEAFYPDVMPFLVGANYLYRATGGFGLRLRLAPVLWIDTGDVLPDGTEFWVRYSAQATYRSEATTFGGGLTGRYALSDDSSGDFGEKSLHEFGLFVNLDYGRWRPSLRIRFPLDEDMKELHDTGFVLGLGIGLK